MGHIESRFDEMISSLWRRRTDGQHIADDSGSTYVAVMFALRNHYLSLCFITSACCS